MSDLFVFSYDAATVLLQVIMIDLVLAGDNAVVIGLAAAGLPPERRARVILVGIVAATVLRVGFRGGSRIQLLEIVGLLLAGGILLLWVCWKMWRELRGPSAEDTEAALRAAKPTSRARHSRRPPGKSSLADISMSLDNVLAVAGPRVTIPWRWCSGSAFRSC